MTQHLLWATVLSLTSFSHFHLLFLSSLSAHLYIPLGPRLLLPPHIICSSGTPVVDAAVNSPCSHPPLQFCWAGLMSLPYRRKVMHPSPKWWRRKGWRRGAGEGSIWLVNFNVKADVSLCTCEISGLENILCYDHMSDCLSYLLSRGHHSYRSTCGLMCWRKGIFAHPPPPPHPSATFIMLLRADLKYLTINLRLFYAKKCHL